MHAAFHTYFGITALCIGTLAMPDISVFGEPPESVKNGKDFSKLINKLASRNAAPELIKGDASIKAIYSDNFEWKDQADVRAVIDEINQIDSEDLWNEFSSHTNDKRYCITFSTAWGRYARNYTVGDICLMLEYHRIRSPFVRHLPIVRGFPFKPDLELDVEKWRQDQPGIKLYEIQIKACELAKAALSELETKAPDEARKARSGIEGEIAKLRRDKKPYYASLGFEQYTMYDAEKAAEVRKSIQKEKDSK